LVNNFSTTKYTKKHEDFIFPFILRDLRDLRDLRGKNKINVLVRIGQFSGLSEPGLES